MNQCGMRAEFQPNVNPCLCQGMDRRCEQHRLSHSLTPVSGAACRPLTLTAGHGTEKRVKPCARSEAIKGSFQGLGSRPHQGMMERMFHLHKSHKNPLLFQLGSDCLQ